MQPGINLWKVFRLPPHARGQRLALAATIHQIDFAFAFQLVGS